MRVKLFPPCVFVLGLFFFSVLEVLGRWAIAPKNVPIARLAENVGRHLKANPKDAHGHYVLGRLHSMAFALRSHVVEVVDPFRKPERGKGLPAFAPWRSILIRTPEKPKRTLTVAHLLNLDASLRHYGMAAKLNPKDAKTRLGLAWMYESGFKVAVAVKSAPAQAGKLPEEQRKHLADMAAEVGEWEERALALYSEVIKLSGETDIKKGFLGPAADSLLSSDAAQAIQRILSKKGRENSPVQQKLLAAAAAHQKRLGVKGRVVTPIIFPLDKPRPLKNLLLTGKTITFDLDGDGVKSRWPWVKPDTGLLVWDPKRTGRILDGRQLFGSVTWWIFWAHGYEPMGMLDDNQDGWLEQRELKGLSVWRDLNGNGVSDGGEVKPVAAMGIKRLSCKAHESASGWSSPVGLEMSDGRKLPTYDWTPRSIPARD